MAKDLVKAREVDVGEWHSQKIDHPLQVTREIQNALMVIGVPTWRDELATQVRPSIPWAEDHFRERISGQPLNPPPSEAWWPYAQQGNAAHKSGEKFSHTYPERFWPKWAGEHGGTGEPPNKGVRFNYGDLDDVVNQLGTSPLTRQAYLPVWFPEDTGAVHKERVPCTLGYQFLVRDNQVNVTYFIRSCDFVRHFRDDVYMAARLLQWVRLELRTRYQQRLDTGSLTMHMVSLHIFNGDVEMLKRKYQIA
jgi:hypothetical protein